MKRLTGPKRVLLHEVPAGHVCDVAGYGWVIPLKPCGLMISILNGYVAVANVDQDHIAFLDKNLPAMDLGLAEIGHG